MRDRIEKAMQYCRPMPRFKSAVFIQNPGTDDMPTIGTVAMTYPETLPRTCEARDVTGRPLSQSLKEGPPETVRTRSSHF